MISRFLHKIQKTQREMRSCFINSIKDRRLCLFSALLEATQMKKTTSESKISLAMMDVLIVGPLDTLNQGQRSQVMGMKDFSENGADKSKAWQNERMSF